MAAQHHRRVAIDGDYDDRVKILLDTDIGGDIDDAFALAYLLTERECDLLGITTVSGRPVVRAQIVSSICRHAGREVAIVPGTELPLLGPQRQPDVPQAEALARWPHDETFESQPAIDFMRTVIRANPGEVVLIAIGPLTNMALLCAVDPEAAALLKGAVVMGGDFAATGSRTEWNFRCDPVAAAMTYQSSIPLIRTVGLDVTTRISMTAAEASQRFATPLMEPVLDYASIYFRDAPRMMFHDPMAAAIAFHDDLFTFATGHVEMTIEAADAGRSTFVEGEPGRHEIATDVRAGDFLDLLTATVGTTSVHSTPDGAS